MADLYVMVAALGADEISQGTKREANRGFSAEGETFKGLKSSLRNSEGIQDRVRR